MSITHRFTLRTGQLALLALSLAIGSGVALAGKPVSRYRLGNSGDATPSLTGPSFFWQGTGSPSTTAFQAHINQVAAGPLDVVILAASEPSSGSKTPECDDIVQLANVNSCETITIPSSSSANDSGATRAVQNAEIVYFAGGNQCDYVGWKGSTVYYAVKDVVARGGGVGGGSAGAAIQGEYIMDGCTGGALSSEALANPYNRYMSFSYDYFVWPNLGQTITDTHFAQRDRMGRLMASVARQIQDGKTSIAYGVGLDEGTTLVVDKLGVGRVYGSHAVYVVLGDHMPELCAPRKPLTFSNFKIWKLTSGATFNFANRPSSGYYLRSVTRGELSANPY